jgi:hypothetical protein
MKIIDKIKKIDIDDVTSKVNFYRYNPHAIPGVKDLLCKLGRHDYEAHSEQDNKVVLQCFYCDKIKTSWLLERK